MAEGKAVFSERVKRGTVIVSIWQKKEINKPQLYTITSNYVSI